MKLKYKKIIAREFLTILFGIILGFLVVISIKGYNYVIKTKIEKTEAQEAEYKSNHPALYYSKFYTPTSEIRRELYSTIKQNEQANRELWSQLIKEGLYTLSYSRFQNDYSDKNAQEWLYEKLKETGKTGLTLEGFRNKYFPFLTGMSFNDFNMKFSNEKGSKTLHDSFFKNEIISLSYESFLDSFYYDIIPFKFNSLEEQLNYQDSIALIRELVLGEFYNKKANLQSKLVNFDSIATFVIVFILLFPIRYLFYAFRWSILTLKS